MRVLITGSSGFVGGNFAKEALASGFDVVAVGHTQPPRFEGWQKATTLSFDLRTGVPDWPAIDAVVHAATNANAVNVSAHDLIEGNVVATKNIVSWMKRRNVRKAVFCSSISAYGTVRQPVLDERASAVDPGVYGMSKLLGESLFREASDTIDCVAIRLPGVLGPNARGSWLTDVAKLVRAGGEVKVFNPDSPFNNCVHVSDVFAMIGSYLRGEASGFDVVNVSAASQIPVIEAVRLIHRELGRTPAIQIVDSEKTSFVISSEKAKRAYGYAPMDVSEMISRYLTEAFSTEAGGCLQ